MDKALADQFSREELEAMGEIEPETTTPGPETLDSATAEPEAEHPTPEQETAEAKEGETKAKAVDEPEPEEGKPVPYDRFKKVYGQAKQTEREKEELREKLDLFKRDQEEYFEKYPDEKPEDWKPATATRTQEPAPDRVIPFAEMLGARVNDPQKPFFHGKTLEELLQSGPAGIAAAHDYYATYVDDVKGKVQEAQSREEARLNEMRQEDSRFEDERATELFGKPMKDLDATQKGQVEKTVKDTLAWMKANKRLAYKLADAWKVMNYDQAISKASEQGAKALVDRAQSGKVRSIGAGPSGEKSTDPYAAYLNLSEEALMEKIGSMTDAQYMKFLENATPAFKQKFPSLAY